MMPDATNWTTNERNSCYISISILSASAPEAILLSSVQQTDLICFAARYAPDTHMADKPIQPHPRRPCGCRGIHFAHLDNVLITKWRDCF